MWRVGRIKQGQRWDGSGGRQGMMGKLLKALDSCQPVALGYVGGHECGGLGTKDVEGWALKMWRIGQGWESGVWV